MGFFVTDDCIAGNQITLPTAEATHIARVLRMAPGEALTIHDMQGMRYDCRLTLVQKDRVVAEIVSSSPYSNEPSVAVTVYAALSKGDRFDYLIQKCVECGVARIVPFVSARCVARPAPSEYEKKRVRFMRIAAEAARQAERSHLPTIGDIVSFSEALAQATTAELPLFLYAREQQKSLSTLLCAQPDARTYALLSGPEGGFAPEEVAQAEQAGIAAVSIGPRILRCETAPVAALCAILYRTGNFDLGE